MNERLSAVIPGNYPGCACDVQSHLYSNPAWSRQFAPQAEIWAYLRHCAEKYGILPHIRHHSKVEASRFDDETSTWVVSTQNGCGHGSFSLGDDLVNSKT